jgi:carboxyl-terminal processing protease
MKKITVFLAIMLLSLVTFTGVIFANGIDESMLTNLFYEQTPTKTPVQADEITTNMQKLELLYRLVERDFLFDIDDDAVYENMAKALFTALEDPYSAYIVAQEAADFNTETTGRYGGIGAYISKNYLEYRDFSKPETYMVNISSVFPGSPAELSGLRAGDLISHIDGNKVDDMEATDASKALKGDPNTAVVLTIQRGSNVFDVTVIRKIVSIPTVSSTTINDFIGYLRITQFTNSTGQQVLEVIDDFVMNNVSALILDLRDNPGGIVDSSLSVADMFLSNVPLVHINSKDETKNRTYVASAGMKLPASTPLVLLVNKGSASSSEILAGALQDNGRATLIGGTTYGKGLIQLVSPFGDGYYTLTTSQYRTPDGNDIHKIGVSADIEVEEVTVPEEDMEIYMEFINSGVAADFVDQYPEYSEENMQLFMDTVVGEDAPLDASVYRLLLRREYLFAIPYDERPIVDPEFDPVLQRAIDLIKNGN